MDATLRDAAIYFDLKECAWSQTPKAAGTKKVKKCVYDVGDFWLGTLSTPQ